MSQHCSHCAEGVLAEGTPQGKEEKIGGVAAYIADGGSTKSAVVIATDAFGFDFVNVRLIADSLAKHTGFFVIVPDILNGIALSSNAFELSQEERIKIVGEWFGKQGPPDGKLPILRAVLDELKQKGFQKIGSLGYCYGGRISVLLAAEDQTVANAICHPARLNIPGEIEAIKHPTLWNCAEIDPTFGKADRDKAEEILKTRGMKAIFHDFPGTTHGFASRGDEKNPKIQEAKVQALQLAIEFFKQELSV